MFRIVSRFEDSAFCEWHECRGCPQRFGPQERELAVAWLRGLLAEDDQVAALRAAASDVGVLGGLAGLNNQQVVDRLAGLLRSDRVRVCGLHGALQDGAVQEFVDSAGHAATSGFDTLLPQRTSGQGIASTPSGPEASSLPGVDPDTMAGSLLAAAVEGSPFCQLCEPPPRPVRTEAIA